MSEAVCNVDKRFCTMLCCFQACRCHHAPIRNVSSILVHCILLMLCASQLQPNLHELVTPHSRAVCLWAAACHLLVQLLLQLLKKMRHYHQPHCIACRSPLHPNKPRWGTSPQAVKSRRGQLHPEQQPCACLCYSTEDNEKAREGVPGHQASM